jgi:hypothetical protein
MAVGHPDHRHPQLIAMGERMQQLSRFGLRALRIAASTMALIELLRSHWLTGAAASLAWLVFLQVERRWASDADQG